MSQTLQIDTFARVVMSTHDEIVTHVRKAQAERTTKKQLEIMRTPPSWCADIPLNAEGGWAENYSK